MLLWKSCYHSKKPRQSNGVRKLKYDKYLLSKWILIAINSLTELNPEQMVANLLAW